MVVWVPVMWRAKVVGDLAGEVGSHTRLKTADVLALRQQRHDAKRRAFDDLRRFEDSIELEDD